MRRKGASSTGPGRNKLLPVTPVATGDREKELQHLVVECLESKIEQIEVVRHLVASCSKQRMTKKRGGAVPRARTAVDVHDPENGEVEIVTTVRPKQRTRPPQPTHKDEVSSSDSIVVVADVAHKRVYRC